MCSHVSSAAPLGQLLLHQCKQLRGGFLHSGVSQELEPQNLQTELWESPPWKRPHHTEMCNRATKTQIHPE